MVKPDWYRPRPYLHFDVPVGIEYAVALTEAAVTQHAWSPLIHYLKKEKRYKALQNKTVAKERPIMFASHRDACILSKYSAELVAKLEKWYAQTGLSETVIAYRSLGRSNYHFAKRVEDFVRANPNVTVMCFDVTGFFDNLDHKLLKERLRWLLGCDELPADWYAVFKAVTKYRFVQLEDLKKHAKLAERLRKRKQHPLATIDQVKALGLAIHKNPQSVGVPQGTPISASISNLYMTAFDEEMEAEARKRGALYQRYSDDILVACHHSRWQVLKALVEEKLGDSALELQGAKTETVHLNPTSSLTFQYLGYQLGHVDARLRNKSLSRQWRTARRALRKIERAGDKAIASGKASKIFTRKLRMRFTEAGRKNFLAYAERSSETLKSPAIKRQTGRLRRYVNRELTRLKGKGKPKP